MLQLDAEYEYLRTFCVLSTKGYWVFYNTHIGFRGQYIHRYIIDATDGDIVDHINGDTSDNRMCNLRLCTSQENSFNSKPHTDNVYSNFKGVSYLTSGKRVKRWRTRIFISGKEKHIGYFATELEAITAATKGYEILHGEHNYLNRQVTL